MKVRSGFVSNSSSSSFVIGLPKAPKSSDDVLNAMYPKDKNGHRRGISDPYGDSAGVDAHTAAHLIWEQIEGKKPMTKDQILEEIKGGYFEGYPDLSFADRESWTMVREYRQRTGKDLYDKDNTDPEVPKLKAQIDKLREEEYKAFDKAVDEAARALFEREYPKLAKKKVYAVSFSDNDGSTGCIMEHGDTFDNVPYVCISHH